MPPDDKDETGSGSRISQHSDDFESSDLREPTPPRDGSLARWAGGLDTAVSVGTRALGLLAGLLILAIAALTVYEVIARKTGNPSSWAFEYARYLFIWAVFVALPFAESDRGQLHIDLIESKLSSRGLWIRQILVKLASVAFLLFVARQSVLLVQHSYDSGARANSIMQTPLWIVELSIPVGMYLSALTIGVSLLKDLTIRHVGGGFTTNDEETI